ncbi:cellulose binding domain-containing protein [Micromonospora sp. C28SCA-DRY-2]|uniref:cellulose binding domain-containing protein n=1 Tax=Micromonospora sp. C28SCA-DRY-2 TaxID=3059522 RepID=UPI002674DF28|nr:cellulose binding domain-containing protein [Micromonospora sp. C28SCA-DRY-2]MDO3703443.1 cellulose binding domain-containing protein [Micromonospora sp. C28SCA-DRY-2]
MSGSGRAPRKSYGTTAVASSPWIVVSIGVAVMVVLLVVALGAYRGRSPDFDAQPGPPPPTVALPELPLPPTGSASPTPSQRATRTPAERSSSPSTRPTPSRSSRAPAPTTGGDDAPLAVPPSPMSGRYRVVNSFHDGFIGEVLIRNSSTTDRDWTARLAFPGGRVDSAWVEGAPQGTMSRTGDGFSYRSGRDLAGGASVALRFYVERADSRPASCTVDDVACTGL